MQLEKELKKCSEDYDLNMDKIENIISAGGVGTKEHKELLCEENRLEKLSRRLLYKLGRGIYDPCIKREERDCFSCDGIKNGLMCSVKKELKNKKYLYNWSRYGGKVTWELAS